MPDDLKGIMSKDVAGLPTWVWVVVVVAGIGAAYLVPRFLGNKGSGTGASTTGTGDASGSGLGLAVDPTTGLPYAVEGLVPSGANAGGGNTTTPVTNPVTPPSTPSPTPSPSIGTIYTLPGQANWAVVGGTVGQPLVPYATQVPGKTGDIFSFKGSTYTIAAGPDGRVWGAPGRMTAAQAQASPTKVLLHAPASYYKPGALAYPIQYGKPPVGATLVHPGYAFNTRQKRVNQYGI